MSRPAAQPDPRADQLRQTIDAGLITTVYQPIVNLERSTICAYEALTRTLPGSAFANPSVLFDAAEACGMLWDLEMVTRRQALRQAADWPSGVLLFLNCTPQVIADDRFSDTLMAELKQTPGLSPHRIVLEVTERSENQHVEGLHRQTLRLQQHGFQLAIDDVGAGTSGLNRIMLLRPQWLKLDRELVEGIDLDPVKTNLVRFLAHFARLSGVTMIGEGIEREGELEQLIRLGVHCAQGYLIGRPGTHDQEIPEPLNDRIRSEWKMVRASHSTRERTDQLARLVRPAHTAEGMRTVAEVATELLAQPAVRGVVVTDGGYYSGWCSRDRICRAMDEAEGQAPLARLAGKSARTLHLGMSIDDALEVASSLRAGGFDQPLVLTESGRVVGLVDLPELLRAAAQACRAVQQRVAPLTGLPGRVRCEQHIDEAIAASKRVDVAFIDLRGLSDYNTVFGFDLGDELIRQLVEVVDRVVQDQVGPGGESFLGHLGDDRLMLALPPGEIDVIADDIVRLFQSRAASVGISPQAALGGLGGASAIATVATRILAIREIGAQYQSAQDVIRTEPTLRALANEEAAMNPVQAGYVVIVDAEPAPRPLALAA